MELRKLTRLGTYEEINAGAHRTAASIIGTPALVRNLGLWSIPHEKGEEASDASRGKPGEPTPEEPTPEDARRSAYCSYIGKLRTLITAGGRHIVAEPDNDAEAYDHVDSGAATLLRFRWHGMLTTIRLEYHNEYITLTSIIDLHVNEPNTCTGKLPDCPRYNVVAKTKAFNELFERDRVGQTFEHKDISDYLQLGVWKLFEQEVIDAPGEGGSILGHALGEIFLDSRGIVTGTRFFRTGTGTGSVHRLRKTFACEDRRPRMRDNMAHERPHARWAHDTVRRLWPFIESEREQTDYEYTVTGFLDGRVLFVTALGPQPSGGAPVTPGRGNDTLWTPIRYFLHAHPDDEWELGRLVDRINALGTMRLAATMEIAALKRAGGLMDDLADKIERAAATIQDAIKVEERGKPESTGEKTQASEQAGDPSNTAAAIAEIREGYEGINGEVAKDIWHRLERSNYYVEQFHKECGALREERIEGFQTYSEFVTRRMSSIFGYIQYLRTRMDDIDTSNSSLERQYSWLKIASVTGEIKLVVDRMTDQNSDIEKIQEFGEVALVGILIPYYLGTMIGHVFDLEKSSSGPLILLLVISAFAGGVLVRRRKKDWTRRGFKAWLSNISVAFCAYLVIVWIVFLVMHRDAARPVVGILRAAFPTLYRLGA